MGSLSECILNLECLLKQGYSGFWIFIKRWRVERVPHFLLSMNKPFQIEHKTPQPAVYSPQISQHSRTFSEQGSGRWG